MYGIPEAISVYEKYSSEGVRVIGVATAFEDYDKNTLANLKMLAETGEVVGDTKRGLWRLWKTRWRQARLQDTVSFGNG